MKGYDPSDLLSHVRFQAFYEHEFPEAFPAQLQPLGNVVRHGAGLAQLRTKGVGQVWLAPGAARTTGAPKATFLVVTARLNRFPRTDWLGNQVAIQHPYPAELVMGAAAEEANAFDVRKPANQAWFLEACRDLVEATRPAFALAVQGGEPRIDGLDLRRTIWPTTYYGPALSKQLGRDRLQGASAWKVEYGPNGGTWLFLDEDLFAWSERATERSWAVRLQLGIDALFPGSLVGQMPSLPSPKESGSVMRTLRWLGSLAKGRRR